MKDIYYIQILKHATLDDLRYFYYFYYFYYFWIREPQEFWDIIAKARYVEGM